MQAIYEKAAKIKLVIFDVDGVLTDGTLFLGDDSQEYKAFFARDGLGMGMLQKSGVQIGIITGRTSEVVRIRMESLNITQVYQGQHNKRPAYEKMKAEMNLSDAEIAYVGDDVVDLPVLTQVGLSIAVNDAHPLVVRHADWRTDHPGGHGAAREVCELIMQAQGTLEARFAAYLNPESA